MKDIAFSIICWYNNNKRNLKFRSFRDPYKIWLSEVMLQQTQVSTMLPYYSNWLKKYPSISSVISTPYDDILKSWEGLGYYKRCLNFYKALKIVHNHYSGIVPKDYNDLIKLPGVGEYTAAAVLSISYNKKFVLIDGNVKRVFSRYLGIVRLTKYNISKMKNFLYRLLLTTNSGTFNQAIMEIGALVCTRYNPKCNSCPLKSNCKAHLRKSPYSYPEKKGKRQLKIKNFFAIILKSEGKFLIMKSKKKLYEGLWHLPMIETNDIEIFKIKLKLLLNEKVLSSKKYPLVKSGELIHVLTHFKLKISYYSLDCDYFSSKRDYFKWISKPEIDKYSFPKLFFKSLKFIYA
tara:strand:+ start:458 stop:1498 length:1041 start_codon:yes stop_codon:yes gene_type:complete